MPREWEPHRRPRPGARNAADVWQVTEARPPSVSDRVAGFTRVCSYDRPGSYLVTVLQGGTRVLAATPDLYRPARGNAVASSTAGDGAAAIADLHTLLRAGAVSPPYVLVGHSLGGVLSLLYARTQTPLAAAAYLQVVPGSRFVAVPETTHYILLERPDVVEAAVHEALAGRTLTSTP